MKKVTIIDYGMGNIRSVRNAIKYLDAVPDVVETPDDLDGEGLIIPGVGAFGDAMRSLDSFLPEIRKAIDSDMPILGICMGMQAFFEGSEESPGIEGLSALKGQVSKVDTDLSLPHIGWNYLDIKKRSCPIFEGIGGGCVYFAHSYHVEPREDIVSAVSEHGTKIIASVWRENIFGTQFHPEKSGKLGLKILQNFLEL